MKRFAVVFVALAAVAFPAAAGAGKIYFEDTIPKTGKTQVSVAVRKPAAFKILLEPRRRAGRSCSCSARMRPRVVR